MAKKINQPLDIEKQPIELKPGQRILKSGVIYDGNTGRFVAQANANPYAITKENTHEFARKRQEKTAALLRKSIIEAHNSSMPTPVKSSAGAFAMAGAMLYEEVVLNSDAYPRDRMEAWEKLGRHAEVLADPRTGPDSNAPLQQATEFITALSPLLELLRVQLHAKDVDVIDAE